MPVQAAILFSSAGTLTAWALWGSVVPKVRQDRERKDLTMDPLPLATALISTLCQCVFASVLGDAFIFLANVPGVLVSVFTVSTALRFGQEGALHKIECLLGAGFAAVVLCLVLASDLVLAESGQRRLGVGSVATVVLLVLYLSPALAAAGALRSGDASALSPALAVAQSVNSALWLAYGLLISEPFLTGPNALGLAVGAFTLLAALRGRGGGAQGYELVPGATVTFTGLWAEQEGLEVLPDGLCRAGASSRLVVERAGGGVRLRDASGRSLQVQPRDGADPSPSWCPTQYRVRAVLGNPGPFGVFLPVYSARRQQGGQRRSGPAASEHIHRAPSVSLYSPAAKCFVRLNELGECDCSCPIVPSPGEAAPPVPAGFEWERFVLTVAPEPQDPAGDGAPSPSLGRELV